MSNVSRGMGVACLLVSVLLSAASLRGEATPPQQIAPGVWFLLGDAAQGYCNTIVIEMKEYLIVVDANYPARARELIGQVKELSAKPVRYVFDTHAHGDHSYGNSVWTAAGATTLAYVGVTEEMERYEPVRWHAAEGRREDVRELHQADVERPRQTFRKSPLVLKDGRREVQFVFLGWGHTRGDGFVWLPKERILCTGDAAVNGPRNKLWDADLANWPRVLARALTLRPLHVLPGHGDAGGDEILRGQRLFLLDLYAEVKRQASEGKTLGEMTLRLPARDSNWTPKSQDQDFAIAYSEITQGKPAGAIAHEWK